MYVIKGDKIYTFYDHAAGRMKRRKIRFEWVEETILNPDAIVEQESPRIAYQKMIDDTRFITVIVDEAESLIITVYEGEENDALNHKTE